MKKLLAMLLACAASCAYAQYIPITASSLTDASGAPVNGTISFAPVDKQGNALSFRMPGAGQAMVTPVSCLVVNGAITTKVGGGTCQLPDTSQTNPVNPCFNVTLTDSLTGEAVQGPGHSCYQPSSLLANGNFDQFIPNNAAIPVQTLTGGIVTTSIPKPLLPDGGYFVTEGDALCDGHGLPGFTSPGYPNAAPAAAWPSVLATLPNIASKLTVVTTCIDGIGLATMDADYTTNVHPLSPAVTGKPGILAISIYGNDTAVISGEGITAYEASYAAHLARARADGWKVMFLAQWQQVGRQQYDAYRIAFNEWNKVNADFYLNATGLLNDPTDMSLFEADGLHPNVEGSREIAVLAQQAILAGGSSALYGTNTESPSTTYPITADVPAGDAASVRNTDNAGYSTDLYLDYQHSPQLSVGYSNPGAVFLSGQAFLNTHAASTPLNLCVFNVCRFTINTDGSYTFLGVEKGYYPALDLHTFQNSAANGYSTFLFLDNLGNKQFSCGYANSSATFLPGGAYCNTQSTSTPFSIAVNNGVNVTFRSDQSSTFYGPIVVPAQKSTTGTRYACFDVNGKLISSATACSGS